jgi:hypothetical protein
LPPKVGRTRLKVGRTKWKDEDPSQDQQGTIHYAHDVLTDAAPSAHDRLCGSDPPVSRADDDVARRDLGTFPCGGYAVRHGPDRLRPPHAEDEVGAGNVRGREGNGSGLGRAEDDVRTSRRPGGDHGH